MRAINALLLSLLLACGGGGEHRSPTEPGPPVVQTASLSGTVTTLGTSSPVAGAVVTAGGLSTTTGSDGKYALTGLSVGQVTLTVTRSGYDTFSRTITLTAGANNQDVQLSQSTSGTSVMGNVHGLYPITGQTVNLAGATVTIAGKTDTTDAGGNFQLPTIPEGNQVVTVKLAGWKDYSQSFFISSTNRNLSIQMEWALPDLRNSVSAQWQVCASPTCGADRNRAFLARLSSTPFTSSTDLSITSTYTYYVLKDGRPVAMSDQLRRGNETSCTAFCGTLPGGQTGSGTVHNGTAGASYTAFANVLGANGPEASARGGNAVWVTWTNPTNSCSMTILCRTACGVTIGVRGTLTIAAVQDTNQWTHYTMNFDQTIPWEAPVNSTFCNTF